MRIAFVSTDNRVHYGTYDRTEPDIPTPLKALLQGFARLPDLEIHILCCSQKPMKSPEKLSENVWYHGLHVPRIGWMRTVYSGCIRAVRKKLKEIQPDIVHGQGTERECAISAALSGFPNVITIHGIMRQVAKALGSRKFSFPWLAACLETWTIGRTQGVFCLTNYTRQQVHALARRTWVVPNAVNESFFSVPRCAGKDSNLVCAASIVPYKNQNHLIRSLDPIASELGIRLFFFGVGNPSDPYFQEFLELIKARPWCVYDGFKKGEALQAHFRTAQLLILPSLEDNCPLVLIEAMAAGLPITASRIGGIPDLIDDGINGLLFDPKKPEEIRAAVSKLITNKQTAEAMAAAGTQHALERYHPIRVAQQHLAVYREVLDMRS